MNVPMYLLLGLLGTGVYMKNRNVKLEGFKTNTNNQVKQSNGKNIYESTEFNNVTNEEQIRVTKRWDEAYDTINTNIVPFYYNTLKEDADIKKIQNPKYDTKLATSLKTIPDQFKELVKSSTSSESNNNGIINPYNSSLESDTWNSMIPDSGKDLKHANMVPFFGSRVTQNMDASTNFRQLENFTGQKPLNQAHKKEIEPLFKPTSGFTNINGTYTEERDMSRYIPNNIGKKNNELPFEKEYVGRGLNDGFTSKPSGGFHNTLRVLPKKTDDMLVNPKFENEARINTGKGETQKRTMEMEVHKNRPELIVNNEQGERNFTTVGSQRESIAVPEYILRDTSKKNNKAMSGCAQPGAHKKHTNEKLLPKSKKSSKQNFKNTAFRNLGTSDNKKSNDYGRSGLSMKPNERMTTGTKKFSTFIKGNKESGKIYNLDKAKSTKKEQYSKAHRAFGNAASNKHKGKVYNVNEKAKGTIRQQTEKNKYKGVSSAIDKKPRSYKDAYAMEQNYDKEIITKMPTRSGSGVKVTNNNVNMETKKLDYDRVNSRAFAKDSASGNVFNPENISKDTITSYKNNLSNEYQQNLIDPSILNAYHSNPLTQSLRSYY